MDRRFASSPKVLKCTVMAFEIYALAIGKILCDDRTFLAYLRQVFGTQGNS